MTREFIAEIGSRRRARPAPAGHPAGGAGGDPLWYKDAVVYQMHVRAFRDSDGDGVGDFRGLTEKLDYLKDLGVTAVWLLPFYPSPLRDDGYDIADYMDVHPAYGTLHDFQVFLREAHARGLRVITELVINHTSDQHPWFQKARRARPGQREREMYVWSDTPDRYADARVIFKDFETSNWAWDPLARAYYWHRFYSHQPDLNFDHPAVREAILKVTDFWLGMGVDGLRLDAIPYLFEREGTNCENLPETHAFLKELRRHVERRFEGRMLLAEANQWPEDAVHYFGEGDECHMAFHFPVMPRMFMAVHMEDRYPLVEILRQTPPIPEPCQWALFLRNHDELTLEMVTDAERDYMYRAYASDARARINLGIRRRLAPLMGNNRRRIELMNSLLFSLPGTPILYYGDEIGMGDNIFLGDRNGMRTPMQWSSDRNAGFSSANPQRLYLPIILDPEYHYEAVNVDTQQANPSSLLWWTKRLIALRKRYRSLARGTIEFLQPENRKVLAFARRWGDECVLVVANLSRFAQYVELDLSELAGRVPVELFGLTRFRPVSEAPYVLTLGPHSFFWFALERTAPEPLAICEVDSPPVLTCPAGGWLELLAEGAHPPLERALRRHVTRARWFAGRFRSIRTLELIDSFPLSADGQQARILLTRFNYSEGESETYAVAVALADAAQAAAMRESAPHRILAELHDSGGAPAGVLYDPLHESWFGAALLEFAVRRRSLRTRRGRLMGGASRGLRGVLNGAAGPLDVRPLGKEQNNSVLVCRGAGDRKLLALKVVRRLEPGVNPDLELVRFLSEDERFPHVPRLLGWLEYHTADGQEHTLGIIQEFVSNEGEALALTIDAISVHLDRALSRACSCEALPGAPPDFIHSPSAQVPVEIIDLMGHNVELMALLGTRTADLHLALAQARDDPALAPEPLTDFDRRSLYQSIVRELDHAVQALRRRLAPDGARGLAELPEPVRGPAATLLERERELRAQLRSLQTQRIVAQRTRVHGDYHLGQLLFTGKDFVVIDFEGDVTRPLAERRRKRCPLWDVAVMLRSLDYAAQTAVRDGEARGIVRDEDRAAAEQAGRLWVSWAGAQFLRAYLERASAAAFLPSTPEGLRTLLNAYLIERAASELSFELSQRPAMAAIPIRGLLALLEDRRET
jgi:maltose alpha-D-glucosyltransferase/alpha-amylase